MRKRDLERKVEYLEKQLDQLRNEVGYPNSTFYGESVTRIVWRLVRATGFDIERVTPGVLLKKRTDGGTRCEGGE